MFYKSSYFVSSASRNFILVPLPFTIHPAIFKVAYFHIHSYADDTQISFHIDVASTDYLNVNLNYLLAISDSCLKHYLKLNLEKSVALLIC